MDSYVCIIPAKYEDNRFPGKLLCDILGKSMIYRTYESVKKWDKWDEIYIATDNQEIFNECLKLNILCLMTSGDHVDCLDRAAEAVEILEAENKKNNKYIIIQGNEPLFNIKTLNVDLSSSIINFYTEVKDIYDMYDSNAVKVVISKNKKALYFSRFTIPYHNNKTKRNSKNIKIFKQIGVYVFTGEMLNLYRRLKPSSLESAEGIGLNRLLENDIEINMRYTKYDSISVDVLEDRERIISLIKINCSKTNTSISNDGKIIDCDGYKIL